MVFVGRDLTMRMGVTMRNLRNAAIGLGWLDGLQESELELTDVERAEHVQRLAEHATATIRSWAMQHQLEEVRKRWPLESDSPAVEAADDSSTA